MTTDEFLAHHGIRGMKWGQRKERSKVEPGKRKKRSIFSDMTTNDKVTLGASALSIMIGIGLAKYGQERQMKQLLNSKLRKAGQEFVKTTLAG